MLKFGFQKFKIEVFMNGAHLCAFNCVRLSLSRRKALCTAVYDCVGLFVIVLCHFEKVLQNLWFFYTAEYG